MIDRNDITGLVLAGGRGSRMGGADKGLRLHRGVPLALHALNRLRPQVGELMVNANRNLNRYRAMGVPVWPDELADFPGPLAGFATGLRHCATPYLATVPCDSPLFPPDLVARLARALAGTEAQIAVAVTGEGVTRQVQPVFCLIDRRLLADLEHYLAAGERRIETWTSRQRCVQVTFGDPLAFANANTTGELAALQQHG